MHRCVAAARKAGGPREKVHHVKNIAFGGDDLGDEEHSAVGKRCAHVPCISNDNSNLFLKRICQRPEKDGRTCLQRDVNTRTFLRKRLIFPTLVTTPRWMCVFTVQLLAERNTTR
ncbi:Phosphatidylinositol 3,4,5-trisphosphate-dependent Rac exchanger 2 protein [Anopheles sinensis]|uniref:Phosphatidylinositol 3,4,5-trisphosphate-dependent Rac exchanger 2 protein n=1 Tax=Anopheles sinensis TaxID=74873 RepID=A0A084WJK4_ANOSI|nr:Phosphatidylinositol 3,4,5-trisphosphate-dependent Rac exchanger 2 protein [Anopheles sinensis]